MILNEDTCQIHQKEFSILLRPNFKIYVEIEFYEPFENPEIYQKKMFQVINEENFLKIEVLDFLIDNPYYKVFFSAKTSFSLYLVNQNHNINLKDCHKIFESFSERHDFIPVENLSVKDLKNIMKYTNDCFFMRESYSNVRISDKDFLPRNHSIILKGIEDKKVYFGLHHQYYYCEARNIKRSFLLENSDFVQSVAKEYLLKKHNIVAYNIEFTEPIEDNNKDFLCHISYLNNKENDEFVYPNIDIDYLLNYIFIVYIK